MKSWTLATGVVDLDDLLRMRQENTTWREDSAGQRGADAPQMVDARDGAFVPAPLRAYTETLPKSFYWPGSAPSGRGNVYLE